MDWLIWTSGGAAGLLVLGLVLVVIVGDRSRGRRRCPKCWHSMEGLPERDEGGWICPECGKAVLRERDLLKTRRSRGISIALVLLLVVGLGYYLKGVQSRRSEGASAWIPNLALLVVVPREMSEQFWLGSQTRREIEELITDRFAASTIPDWQRRFLLWRLWRFDEHHAWAMVRVPDVWIQGEPIPIRIEHGLPLTGMLHEEIRVRGIDSHDGRNGHWSPYLYDFSVGRFRKFNPNMMVSYIPPRRAAVWKAEASDEEIVTLELEATAIGVYPNRTQANSQFSSVRQFTVELVENEQALWERVTLAPTRDPDIDRVLGSYAGLVIGPYTSKGYDETDTYIARKSAGMTWYDIVGDVDSPPDSVRHEMEVELLYESEVIFRKLISHWSVYASGIRRDWKEEAWRDLPDRNVMVRAFRDLHEWALDYAAGDDDDSELSKFTVRFTPRPDIALRETQSGRYWAPANDAAFLEVPLSAVIRRPRR